MKLHASLVVAVMALEAGFAARAQNQAPYEVPAFVGRFVGQSPPPEQALALWYRRPAVEWEQALPVGNGRLGAMVFGGIVQEHLTLNEDTLWSGGPYDPTNPEALAALPQVRALIFAGKYREAHKLVEAKMMARPLWQAAYQPVGSLLLTFPDVAAVDNYRRDLDLDTAIARVSYQVNGVHFVREVFASPVDQVVVVRLTADKPGQVAFTAGLSTPQTAAVMTTSDDTLVLTGHNGKSPAGPGRLTFQARVRVTVVGGKTTVGKDSISVEGAESATLFVAMATSYKSFKDVSGDPEAQSERQLAAAAKKSYADLRAAHIAEHQRLFRRVSLDLGISKTAQLPTDERLLAFTKGGDPQLAALYFQFGRYLLISSSRPGGQPANLQGLWNYHMEPPWGSKYTININAEMNYWPAETTNLSECFEPLLRLMRECAGTGAIAARDMYHRRGWVIHHNTTLWRDSFPVDGVARAAFWNMAAPWLVSHLWEHWLFTGDRAFLDTDAYPLMKGAAEFCSDWLIETSNGELVTPVSTSPENAFQGPDGRTASVSIGVLDLEAAAGTNDPYGSLKQDFQIAKQVVATDAVLQGATDGGATAVLEAYHATLVAPFCLAAAKAFFANH